MNIAMRTPIENTSPILSAMTNNSPFKSPETRAKIPPKKPSAGEFATMAIEMKTIRSRIPDWIRGLRKSFRFFLVS